MNTARLTRRVTFGAVVRVARRPRGVRSQGFDRPEDHRGARERRQAERQQPDRGAVARGRRHQVHHDPGASARRRRLPRTDLHLQRREQLRRARLRRIPALDAGGDDAEPSEGSNPFPRPPRWLRMDGSWRAPATWIATARKNRGSPPLLFHRQPDHPARGDVRQLARLDQRRRPGRRLHVRRMRRRRPVREPSSVPGGAAGEAPAHLELVAPITVPSLDGWFSKIVLLPSSSSELLFAATSSDGTTRRIHGLRAAWPAFGPITVDWTQAIVPPVGTVNGLFDLAQSGGDLYVAGAVSDLRKSPPSGGGSWSSGFATSFTGAGLPKWSKVVSLTQHSEHLYSIAVGPDAVYAAGAAGATCSRPTPGQFRLRVGHEARSRDRNALADFTFGDEKNSSGFDGAT